MRTNARVGALVMAVLFALVGAVQLQSARFGDLGYAFLVLAGLWLAMAVTPTAVQARTRAAAGRGLRRITPSTDPDDYR
jgi:hypothetical protein